MAEAAVVREGENVWVDRAKSGGNPQGLVCPDAGGPDRVHSLKGGAGRAVSLVEPLARAEGGARPSGVTGHILSLL